MELTEKTINLYFEKYQHFVDEITLQYHYASNISHLLYVIVPAFVQYYGIRAEHMILNVFREVSIIVCDRNDRIVQAAFSRRLQRVGQEYYTEKHIYLYCYKNASFIEMLDNLVHEFNHAVNSYKNEILVHEKNVCIRSGLTYSNYSVDMLEIDDSHNEIVLEEIVNTRQVEKIIQLISSFSQYEIYNSEISNAVYVIKQHIGDGYRSKAYYLETAVCRKLLENTSFIHTIENLRLQGEVADFSNWFDTVVGESGSFQRLNRLLVETLDLERQLASKKWFRKYFISKIQKLIVSLLVIVDKFNQNSNFH